MLPTVTRFHPSELDPEPFEPCWVVEEDEGLRVHDSFPSALADVMQIMTLRRHNARTKEPR